MKFIVYTARVRTKQVSLRNITLSAPADRIDQARRVAIGRGQTLNDAFRNWLEEYASAASTPNFEEFVKSLGPIDFGPIPSREERNARR